MNKERYLLQPNDYNEIFWFVSQGPNGDVLKGIEYENVSKNFFNLVFGDWDEINQKLNDKTRTNNGDRDKVLTTVADSVIRFMDSHPYAIVYAKGETPVKTRLYQMGINKNWAEISAQYLVYGYRNGYWAPFEPG